MEDELLLQIVRPLGGVLLFLIGKGGHNLVQLFQHLDQIVREGLHPGHRREQDF